MRRTTRGRTPSSALTAYPELPPGSNIEAWLVTIAHRKAIDHVRARARRATPVMALPERPDDRMPSDRESELWAAVGTLTLRQRECVAYHHIVGLPYAEVAQIVGGSAAAARRAAADGVAALRALYRASHGEQGDSA